MEQIKTLIPIYIWRFPCDNIRLPITTEIGVSNPHVRSTIWTFELQRIHWQTDIILKYGLL